MPSADVRIQFAKSDALSRVSAAALTLFPLAVAQSGDLCFLGSSPPSKDSGFSRAKYILYRHPPRTSENDSISVFARPRKNSPYVEKTRKRQKERRRVSYKYTYRDSISPRYLSLRLSPVSRHFLVSRLNRGKKDSLVPLRFPRNVNFLVESTGNHGERGLQACPLGETFYYTLLYRNCSGFTSFVSCSYLSVPRPYSLFLLVFPYVSGR